MLFEIFTYSNDVFFILQETVLDAKLEDLNQEDISNNQESVSCLPADSVAKLQDSHNRLQDAILKYENIVDRLETLWKIKVNFYFHIWLID